MNWWLGVVPGEQLQSLPIPSNQRLLFNARPAFDLLFERKCLFSGRCRLNEDQFDWQSLGNPRVRLRLPMCRESHFRVVRMTRVESTIGTLQDVNVERHDFSLVRVHGSTSSPRTEGVASAAFTAEPVEGSPRTEGVASAAFTAQPVE